MAKYKYGSKSEAQLRTLYPFLQLVMLRTLIVHDHSLDQGGRSEAQQLALYNAKPQRSKLKPPAGKHVMRPDPTGRVEGLWSFAVDTTPFINGRRLATSVQVFHAARQAQFARFLGIIETNGRDVLQGTGWHLRFGINWDEDAEILTDQKFDDWFHVEVVPDG